MGTVLRSEISKKNKWYIEKQRYYELKHFCMQYPLWIKEYAELESNIQPASSSYIQIQETTYKTCFNNKAIELFSLNHKITLVKDAALSADKELADYILKGVTMGIPYDILKLKFNIPCSKNVYYDRYRKFFYLLDKSRQ